MRNTLKAFAIAAMLLGTMVPLSAQAPSTGQKKTVASKGGYNPPRTADGHVDLQGTYDLATLTPMERRAGTPLVLTKEQALKLEKENAETREKLDAPIQ